MRCTDMGRGFGNDVDYEAWLQIRQRPKGSTTKTQKSHKSKGEHDRTGISINKGVKTSHMITQVNDA